MSVLMRQLQSLALEALSVFPAVYINGPRQAGKTTLVRQLLKESFDAAYLTFDDMLERSAATRNPMGYIKDAGVPLIIDEVQMVPGVFRPLKQLIDEQRYDALNRNDTANGHYLLTGSANLLALPELADAMVGRMATLTLLPLSSSEVMGGSSSFIGRCFAQDFSNIGSSDVSLLEAIRKASFPEISLMPDKMITHWFHNYVQKITLEDPRDIYHLEKAEFMPVLLQSLAVRAGNLINDASIGREVGLNAVTTRNYRHLLNRTFVTHNLSPWYRNITKRLVKSHKVFFYDTMLLCHLLQSKLEDLPKMQPQRFGHIVENFVFSELHKIKYANRDNIDITFYRTNDGREVDFVLEYQKKLVAIEVKCAENITDKDLLGIKELQQVAGEDFLCGIVLCNTSRVISYDSGIYLVPFSALWC